eukprot:gnl/TRDRNA2_/TRDRNA2_186094_c0_seq1.p1 gnl/TRDRNA2_/TRDRNA2_186094_c0~~gnl/TRDRNA2_/TRDRNA2_186094_c0_seq1.p1  ORF type:complete len:426 (-),score=94.70 gnl/TRDRNA2_/TRDRNA2_186094_c0_seq1:164-1441(-)
MANSQRDLAQPLCDEAVPHKSRFGAKTLTLAALLIGSGFAVLYSSGDGQQQAVQELLATPVLQASRTAPATRSWVPGFLGGSSRSSRAERMVTNAEKKGLKVCVCGGSGGIGQPLSLLLSTNPNVAELSVYDLTIAAVPPEGVAADLGHIEKNVAVKGYAKSLEEKASDVLGECLTGSDLVLVPAGLPRKPGMTRDDLFGMNADIAKEIVEATAKFCPDAVVGLIVNPVNSIVPAMAELYKKAGLDPLKIVGVTSLDMCRANKFVAEITGKDADDIEVPVIGGHAGVTILPVFSQDPIASTIPADKIPALDEHVQVAGTDVVNAKAGKGSATLSMAYAAARMAKAVLSGMQGTPQTECAYVMSDAMPGLPYFSSKVTFGAKGVQEVAGIGEINEYEQGRLAEAKEALQKEIETGLKYAEANELKK